MSAVSGGSRLPALCVSLLCLSLVGAEASFAADTYPTHPVKIIAPFAAGGPSDFVARLLADKLSQNLGQQFYVEDHAGAGGNIGMTQVARSAPDGYTILVASSSYVVNPSLYAHPPYDPFKDFAPITLAGVSANILLAHPSVPAKTVKDLIALMQANPGKYAIANAGLGTTPELAAELFKLDFKLDQPSVPYSGGAPAVQAVIANQTPLGFANLTPAAPHILAGTLHGMAVTSLKRSAALPNVPTMVEEGVQGQESETMQGVFVAAGTPQPIVDALNRAIVEALHQPDVQEKCKQVGLDIVADTPAEFAVYIKKEVDRWHKVIVDAKIRKSSNVPGMRIVDFRETAVPLNSALANSGFNFSEMTTSVVAAITDVKRDGKPVTGFAFNSTGRYACGAQMRARFIPRILTAPPASLLDEAGENFAPEKILATMMQNEKSGGHSERSMAVGTIEVAVWDAVAKIAGKPLHAVLAERYNGGKVADKVFCYVGAGWYAPGKTTQDLLDEMRRHLDAGYTMLKMKVGGMPLKDDLARVAAVKAMLPQGGALAVDANSKFSRDDALAYARALRPFALRWFEEPCDPLDYALLAEIAGHYDAPLSTGENLYSTQDVENLVRFGGLTPERRDVIQVDPPQAYGIVQYARTLDMLARHGWPRSLMFPHGGNQMSLAIAAGFGLGGAESYPGVFGDFGGFADDAKLAEGYLTLSDRPGIGFEGQARLYRIMRELAA